MRLLHAGIDTTVIALWLGHEQVETTQMHIHADLALKEEPWPARNHWTANPAATARQTRSSDSLIACDPLCAKHERRAGAGPDGCTHLDTFRTRQCLFWQRSRQWLGTAG